MSDSNPRRDLELILLGATIVKSEREKMLAVIGDDLFSREIGALIANLRSGEPQDIVRWFAERGAKPEKGQDLIQAALARITDDNEREKLQAIIRGLGAAGKLEETKDLKVRMLAVLKQLESMV